MKSSFFVTLILSGAVALPAFTQQANSSSGTQQAGTAPPSATSPSSDQPREPLRPVESKDFWDGDQPNVVNLILHPFASKSYVRRQTEPIRDRINELEGITTADSAKIKDVDARSQQGIQLASEKTNLAEQHTSDAASRSQLAQNAATQASTRVSNGEQIVGNLDHYKSASQTEIRFRPGQTVLSKQAKDVLDQLAAPLKQEHDYIIEVQGFAPGRGNAAIAASQKMADSVMRFLVLNHQIPVYRIYTVGMGSAPVAGEGTKHSTGGRVEVSLLKNDLVSSAQH